MKLTATLLCGEILLLGRYLGHSVNFKVQKERKERKRILFVSSCSSAGAGDTKLKSTNQCKSSGGFSGEGKTGVPGEKPLGAE